MAESVTKLVGLDELEKLMKKFTGKTQRRINLNALSAMARVVAKEAKSRVPARTGGLRDAITVKRPRRGGTVKIGFKRPDSGKAHLVEFGTALRVKKDGKSTGRVAAQPFMRPALDATETEAFAKYGKIMLNGLVRESKKARKTGR
ncbi:MAG: HK97 gp10 family phage protein [Robiginitomaculum sp.]|nr:HK97 gp10 family phage protein [Robiginitomaculum sp.]